MKINDSVFGVAFLLFGVLVLWNSSYLPTIPGQNVGPAAFPSLLAILLIVCGGLLTARGVTQSRNEALISLSPWTQSWPHVRSFLLVIAALVFYVMTSDYLGFHLCAFLIMMSLFLSLRVTWWKACLVAIGTIIVVHLLFYKMLRVPLPWGLMPALW